MNKAEDFSESAQMYMLVKSQSVIKVKGRMSAVTDNNDNATNNYYLLPSARSQPIGMCKNHLRDRTQRISGYEKALFQLHWLAQIITMQKHCDLSTSW